MTIKRKAAPATAAPTSSSVAAAVTATHPSQNPARAEATSDSGGVENKLGGGSSCKGPAETKAHEEKDLLGADLTQNDRKMESPGLGGLFAGYGSGSDDEGEG